MVNNRRYFIKKLGISVAGLTGLSILPKYLWASGTKMDFQISLAQWSLHDTLYRGKLSNMDFPKKAITDFGIDIVEYVNVFFEKKDAESSYIKELKNRTYDLGVKNHLIMVDGEGDLGNIDSAARDKAVENHYKWVEIAKVLGCKSIRVNASGKGTKVQVKEAAVDGLGKLSEYGKANNINVIVENHGGFSSDGKWLAAVMRQVNSPYCGTLPDFGNFRISENEEYDKYKGVQDLVPYAKGLSAKSFDFNTEGDETSIDYHKMFKIIKDSGWNGIVGIEYEGSRLNEDEGIMATKRLLEKIKSI